MSDDGACFMNKYTKKIIHINFKARTFTLSWQLETVGRLYLKYQGGPTEPNKVQVCPPLKAQFNSLASHFLSFRLGCHLKRDSIWLYLTACLKLRVVQFTEDDHVLGVSPQKRHLVAKYALRWRDNLSIVFWSENRSPGASSGTFRFKR